MRVERLINISNIKIRRMPINEITFRYAKDLENGSIFPAIKVAKRMDGTFEIRDGRHRLLAHKLTGRRKILARYSKRILKGYFALIVDRLYRFVATLPSISDILISMRRLLSEYEI